MNGPFAALRWVFLWRDKSAFLEGFGMTILVSLCALLLAVVLGIIFGLFQLPQKKF
jgi:putative glutamine transport system permease protein